MFPDLITSIYDQKKKNIKRLPCHANRASSLGGVCERELVYDRVAWDRSDLHDVHLQLIFEEGNLHEDQLMKDLKEAGFTVIEQQTTLEWKEYQIVGHIDCVVVIEGRGIPLDAKSMSDHIFSSIFRRGPGVYEFTEVEPLLKKPWLKKYLGQITLYALLKNCEDGGILLVKNKSTGAIAQVNVPLDYEYGEYLLKRAERINQHVKSGTLPDRIPFDEDVCPKCKYYSLCLPDHIGKDPMVFLEDSTIEYLLETRSKLEENGKEFDRVDKRLKEWAKARSELKIMVGNWLVTKNGGARVTVKFERL